MNPTDKQIFDDVAKATRQEMLRLTPGQRILRALELHELGMRLKQATAAAQEQPAMSSQNQPPPGSSAVSPAIRAIIAQTKPEDYNGHTEFSRMSPAERLTWLDQAVLFIAAQKTENSTGQVTEPPATPYKSK